MHSTHLRNTHIHGAILGAAIGESLGQARHGLSRRTALRMYGRPPLDYRFLVGRGVYGDQTRTTLLNAQALLNSRSDLRSFRRAFTWRLSWYLLSIPVGASRPVLLAALRSWLMRARVAPGVESIQSGAATRAVVSALAIHGTGHRLPKWIDDSTKLTHTHPLAIDSCRVLAILASQGCTAKTGSLNKQQVLETAIAGSTEPLVSEPLTRLVDFLQADRSPSAVARNFGWDTGVDDDILQTTIMSAYCWLRYPSSYLRATQSAIALGGNAAGLGAIVGSLVGAHTGREGIPDDFVERLGGSPHGPPWMEALAERFSHWPHGHDDLHLAPAQTSDPLMQIVRNVSTIPLYLLNRTARLPYKLLKTRQPLRLRRRSRKL